jgi:hypothetical protein
MRIEASTSTRTVGSKKCPPSSWGESSLAPPDRDPGTFLERVPDLVLDVVTGLGGDDGADVGSVLQPVPDPKTLREPGDPLDERRMNVLMDDDAAGRRALLAGGEHCAVHDVPCSSIEVGVLEHDRSIVAA